MPTRIYVILCTVKKNLNVECPFNSDILKASDCKGKFGSILRTITPFSLLKFTSLKTETFKCLMEREIVFFFFNVLLPMTLCLIHEKGPAEKKPKNEEVIYFFVLFHIFCKIIGMRIFKCIFSPSSDTSINFSFILL